jgi:hypothetical protein
LPLEKLVNGKYFPVNGKHFPVKEKFGLVSMKVFSRGDHFRFGSVFIKKSNQTEIFFFKKTETGSNRPVSVRFVFLGQKPVQTALARFFWFGSVFPVFCRFQFGSVFSVFCL